MTAANRKLRNIEQILNELSRHLLDKLKGARATEEFSEDDKHNADGGKNGRICC
jgi:hypothetical protein